MRQRFFPSLTLRRVFFLVPGTTNRYRCGGLSVALHTARLVNRLLPTDLVTYRQRQDDYPFLDDLLEQEPAPGEDIWVVSWGFEVPKLLRCLRGRSVVYHAHSSGYGFDLPLGVPVLAVSRNTLGYWGDRAPHNPLFLVPNALEPHWFERGARPGAVVADSAGAGDRSIDVLVQERKSSRYVLEQLVPALRNRGLKVVVQSSWVDDLVALFNAAKVYIYDSADYWRSSGVSEGFGLPPLEAMACGCVVFSSFNHALADTLEPSVMGHQIGCSSLAWDVWRICEAVNDPLSWYPPAEQLDQLLSEHSETALISRWKSALAVIETIPSDQVLLSISPTWRLRAGRFIGRGLRALRRLFAFR